ncbi:hypothetical protein ACFXGI_34645 [Streptomyces sp. NPDC059355]|uniref:hypothetical protein n=1 Tax=Streptomyces sp. NPDC059355 TaxID=3346811 RepID=UPI00367C085A
MTKNTPVRDLADRFGRSSSSWGNYLNGSQLIPKQLVARLVESFTIPGPRRETMAVEALKLWNAADAERRAGRFSSGGGDLVRQHQRRDDALQQVIKYQALAANAEKHLAELRPMLAYTQSRLENAELQLKLGDERERTRRERQLGQARERLGRVQVQQERARGRRMTAEEQQEFWMAEVLATQEEIRRLESEARDLEVISPAALQPVHREASKDVDDADFDARLEHITAEGLEDEALIEEDLQPEVQAGRDDADEPLVVQAVQDGVQLVSKMLLDKPAIGEEGTATPAPEERSSEAVSSVSMQATSGEAERVARPVIMPWVGRPTSTPKPLIAPGPPDKKPKREPLGHAGTDWQFIEQLQKLYARAGGDEASPHKRPPTSKNPYGGPIWDGRRYVRLTRYRDRLKWRHIEPLLCALGANAYEVQIFKASFDRLRRARMLGVVKAATVLAAVAVIGLGTTAVLQNGSESWISKTVTALVGLLAAVITYYNGYGLTDREAGSAAAGLEPSELILFGGPIVLTAAVIVPFATGTDRWGHWFADLIGLL